MDYGAFWPKFHEQFSSLRVTGGNRNTPSCFMLGKKEIRPDEPT